MKEEQNLIKEIENKSKKEEKRKKFKFPLVSRKKYEKVRNNYKVAMGSLRALRKAYIEYQTQKLKEINNYKEQIAQLNAIVNKFDGLSLEFSDAKKEIKRLKYLCTRNGVKYKKEGLND